VEKSGSWFSYKGERIARQGTARQFLKDNADIRLAIDSELRKLLGWSRRKGRGRALADAATGGSEARSGAEVTASAGWLTPIRATDEHR